jgi:hypothetical protein
VRRAVVAGAGERLGEEAEQDDLAGELRVPAPDEAAGEQEERLSGAIRQRHREV